MIPPRIKRNSLLTSAYLNQVRDESLRARMSQVGGGAGTHSVNDIFGNHGVSPAQGKTRLCKAIEDFRITNASTDLYSAWDEVPSGQCLIMCLNPATGAYQAEGLQAPFRVWDPIGGLNSLSVLEENNIFYAHWNEDSQRWEVQRQESPAIQVEHGLVCRCIGRGWYVVELKASLGLDPPEATPVCELTESSSSSLSSSSATTESCDLCDLTEGMAGNCDVEDYSVVCGTAGEFNPQRPRKLVDPAPYPICYDLIEGSGVYVFAYDKRAVPLKEGGQVTIAWIGDVIPGASDSEDPGEDEKIFVVLNGEYKMVVIPHEVWECCEGVEQLVSCTTFLVEGVACVGPTNPCTSGSSGGASEGEWL